jgi:hypothetical protein
MEGSEKAVEETVEESFDGTRSIALVVPLRKVLHRFRRSQRWLALLGTSDGSIIGRIKKVTRN